MPSAQPRPSSASSPPTLLGVPIARRVGGRYELVEELGRGGMAQVYRAIDVTSGRSVALKQLLPHKDAKREQATASLFEREFHTLAQLSHPRVIEVHDYGVDDIGPYYTMELLDGGDLRERSPLPWREACELLYDVCSSLALLHSRRFVHRDVSPRNVRCTHDGHAKLLDFGAMVPMGSGSQLVGTPPFVAPEVVHGSMLDARTDLFSLGATFYFALTGRLAYPARDFTQLIESWAAKPPPTSAIVADIPSALDRLVSSLISLEPALRPRSAFEVMQHLAAIANIERAEPLSVSSGYLVTPTLVGRADVLETFRLHMQRALHGRTRQGLLFAAAPGLGRSRMLDASALEAKMLGAHVLRARAQAGAAPALSSAHALAEQLLESLPEVALRIAQARDVFSVLFETDAAPTDGAQDVVPAAPRLKSFDQASAAQLVLQRALADWFLHVSDEHALLIAVDDVQRIDDASIAFLAVLAQRGGRHHLLVSASVEQSAFDAANAALEVLASQCQTVQLRVLDLDETEQLLSSVFGDVPNMTLLRTRIHAIAGGNPRECMLLAQHLVDRGSIRYDGGNWTLPEQLGPSDLPASAEEAFRVRLGTLQPLSRRLVEAQALASQDAFTLEDYRMLEPDVDTRAIDAAITELAAQQIVIGDGQAYLLTQRKAAICAQLSSETQSERHRALAQLQQRSGRPVLSIIRHLLLSGQYEPALDRLALALQTIRDRADLVASSRLDAFTIAATLQLALHQACALGRAPSEVNAIRRWLMLLSIASDDALYWQAAPAWLEQLKLDSGLRDWQDLRDVSEPGPRLMQALKRATLRYAATPETQRVYPPDEAIRQLVHFVVISIAIGARTLDAKLLLSLPELLEPFAPLTPLVHAIWQNALATRESGCYRQSEQACARWIEVYERLGQVQSSDPALLDSIRNAVAFGVGLAEASMGIGTAMRWADILDRDPLQQVNAMSLRKVMRLQQGDLEGAERFRKQAELLAVQSSLRQMFSNMLTLEIGVHAAAWDLTGVTQIAARIAPFAERYHGWLPFRHLAQGHFQRLRGDLEAACRAFEHCLQLCAPDPNEPTRSIIAWPPATAGLTETLVALGRAEEARSRAESALAQCTERGMAASAHEIRRALALAEARLSMHAAAAERLDGLIAEQRGLGVVGLNLGASYEARARIAIWAGDRAAVEQNGRLAAAQYRHGHGSSLGARYERLMDEARSAGITVLPQLSAFESTVFGTTDSGTRLSTAATIAAAMSGAADAAERAQRALQFICDARGASAGYLYLAAGGKLALVAANAGAAPDDGMQAFVMDYWSRQIGDVDTDMPADGVGDSAYGTVIWTDDRGAVHQPLLVSGVIDGVIVHAGVAVLIPNPARSRTRASMQIVAELAVQLIGVGDTPGVR